mmetsp:Transcript_12119/g.29806  ORF Transcript_12119/g.29806 Transcript_12119/m.29806 type:complete len:125 (-) Transcript_12119:186-560(-)|eukprot:CAMPEP_0114488078 /NCGR_PEP_ID=MMETSP0109-20121206/1124_1 /TAXON_ID=29199 /ORGANISM="Chlorarachnion reptans, Strain CCCM449" /LENGTH=124 /DNA_ID=CAMNT_0001664419 /DNA_START=803 /DNA_END=1177 /DNA_ORIENTATION=+
MVMVSGAWVHAETLILISCYSTFSGIAFLTYLRIRELAVVGYGIAKIVILAVTVFMVGLVCCTINNISFVSVYGGLMQDWPIGKLLQTRHGQLSAGRVASEEAQIEEAILREFEFYNKPDGRNQ